VSAKKRVSQLAKQRKKLNVKTRRLLSTRTTVDAQLARHPKPRLHKGSTIVKKNRQILTVAGFARQSHNDPARARTRKHHDKVQYQRFVLFNEDESHDNMRREVYYMDPNQHRKYRHRAMTDQKTSTDKLAVASIAAQAGKAQGVLRRPPLHSSRSSRQLKKRSLESRSGVDEQVLNTHGLQGIPVTPSFSYALSWQDQVFLAHGSSGIVYSDCHQLSYS
jgi:hypothetical protein